MFFSLRFETFDSEAKRQNLTFSGENSFQRKVLLCVQSEEIFVNISWAKQWLQISIGVALNVENFLTKYAFFFYWRLLNLNQVCWKSQIRLVFRSRTVEALIWARWSPITMPGLALGKTWLQVLSGKRKESIILEYKVY